MPTTTGEELQTAIKSMALGMFKGNTADTLGAPVDMVNTAIKPITERLGIATDTPFGGSAHFRTLFGMDVADKNVAETAGSMLSVGGAAKAMIVGAARLGKVAGSGVDVAKAEELFVKHPGVNAASVYNMTGAYADSDGLMLKAVISDKAAKTKNLPKAGETKKLDQILDHPQLFELYPELRNTDVRGATMGVKEGSFLPGSSFGPATIKISGMGQSFIDAMRLKDGTSHGEADILNTLLHEVQHNVQNIEGFAKGGNPKQFLPANVDSQAKAVQAAVIRARESSDPSIRDAAERFKARFNEKIKDAHIKYENIPGEQEARFTQQTAHMNQAQVSGRVLDMLRVTGDTPQTYDTQQLPSALSKLGK